MHTHTYRAEAGHKLSLGQSKQTVLHAEATDFNDEEEENVQSNAAQCSMK